MSKKFRVSVYGTIFPSLKDEDPDQQVGFGSGSRSKMKALKYTFKTLTLLITYSLNFLTYVVCTYIIVSETLLLKDCTSEGSYTVNCYILFNIMSERITAHPIMN